MFFSSLLFFFHSPRLTFLSSWIAIFLSIRKFYYYGSLSLKSFFFFSTVAGKLHRLKLGCLKPRSTLQWFWSILMNDPKKCFFLKIVPSNTKDTGTMSFDFSYLSLESLVYIVFYILSSAWPGTWMAIVYYDFSRHVSSIPSISFPSSKQIATAHLLAEVKQHQLNPHKILKGLPCTIKPPH